MKARALSVIFLSTRSRQPRSDLVKQRRLFLVTPRSRVRSLRPSGNG